MKMSEAMRIGSKMHGQCLNGHYGTDENGKTTTCALSAAAIGAGILNKEGEIIPGQNSRIHLDIRTGKEVLVVLLPEEFTMVNRYQDHSPCDCTFAKNYVEYCQQIIWHLNDIHHWSREAVAEWVEVIENKIEAENAKKNEKAEEISPKVVDGNPIFCG